METSEDNISYLQYIKFILLLIFQIPSIIISIIIFLFFITHRRSLQDLRHQSLLLLLLVNFIQLSFDLPMAIHFYHTGYVSPSTSSYCTWWTFFEYSLDVISALLMVVISIQRHILVFHEHILHVRLKRWIFYYAPLIFSVIYPLILYMIIIVIYPCDGTQWDYTSNVCGFANCYLVYSKTLATFDWTAQNGLPTLIIILANIVLILRVIKQKRRHQQRIVWKKQRRMTLQLFSISILFLMAWVPSLSIGLGQQVVDPSFLAQIQKDYALDLIYLMCLFLPWVCLGQLPVFTRWIFRQICHQGTATTNTVRPA